MRASRLLRSSAVNVEAACCGCDSSATIDTSNMLLPEDTATVCKAVCSASPKAVLGSAESGKRVRKEQRWAGGERLCGGLGL